MRQTSTALFFLRRAWICIAAVSLAAISLSACTYESALTGLECDNEGGTRQNAGKSERCQDGYWHVEPQDDLDASVRPDGNGADPDIVNPPDSSLEPDSDDRPDTQPPEDTREPPEDTNDTPDTQDPTPDVVEPDTADPTDVADTTSDIDEPDTEHPDAGDAEQPDGDTAECSEGDEEECVSGENISNNPSCINGTKFCDNGVWSACQYNPAKVECDNTSGICDGEACGAGGTGTCYESSCCETPGDDELLQNDAFLESVCNDSCGEVEVPSEYNCGESGRTIDCSNKCGSGQACEFGECCDARNSGDNRCLGQSCRGSGITRSADYCASKECNIKPLSSACCVSDENSPNNRCSGTQCSSNGECAGDSQCTRRGRCS